MKKQLLLYLLTAFMSMVWQNAYAYDIAVKNADGVTIYYNWNKDKTELGVTYLNEDANSYHGIVVIPESVKYEGKVYSVTDIGVDAFHHNSLTSITIPSSITSIGGDAFFCCELTSVHISDLSAWCKISFGDNPLHWAHHLYINGKEITNLEIPNSVTSIGYDAFNGCSGLTSVIIGNSVTSIGGRAFNGCSGLTTVTIGNSVTSIGYGAFNGCSSLTSIKVESGNEKYDSRNNCNAIIETSSNTLIAGCKNTIIPNSVTSIGSDAFGGCSGLTSVTIPNSITSIGRSAFEGCSGLTSVSIPNSVTSIGWEAFSGCSGLTSVTIPNGCIIGQEAFEDCSGLTSITLSGRVSCDDRAFSGCGNLNAVHILDLEAFLHSTFELEDGPSNPLFYAHHLYLNGEEIKVLVIPNTITQINDCVFMGCSDLTSITIPNSVISIGRLAFYGCSGLTSVFIPNSVTSIGSSAFADCSGLTSVTIPNSVTSISDHAFYNCSGLTTITLEIEKPFEIFSGTFSDDTYNVAELIVPYGTKAAYQATEGWNKFTMITEAQDRDVVTFTIDAITYEGSKSEKTVVVKAVDAKLTNIKIPVSVNYDGITYQVSGIIDGIFDGSNMAALIWDVEASLPNNAFSNASIGSNFLLYVKSSSYAPSSVKNVVVDGTAQTIVLSDDGGQFYCPQAFTARRISYSHNYSMETGKGSTMGWESIALPFDVQRIIHNTQGEIVPFAAYSSGSNQKPFWLAYMSASGFKRTADIRANEAYIIAMPNNSSYQDNYILAGDVTFSAENITVPKTPTFNGTFLPAFSFVAKSSSVYALNVNNRYVRYSGSEKPGSIFIRDLRDVRPFEAYFTGNFTRGIIEINYDNSTTDILDVLLSTDDSQEMTIHTLSGQQVTRTTQRDFDSVWQQLPKGVYIVSGKKLIK